MDAVRGLERRCGRRRRNPHPTLSLEGEGIGKGDVLNLPPIIGLPATLRRLDCPQQLLTTYRYIRCPRVAEGDEMQNHLLACQLVGSRAHGLLACSLANSSPCFDSRIGPVHRLCSRHNPVFPRPCGRARATGVCALKCAHPPNYPRFPIPDRLLSFSIHFVRQKLPAHRDTHAIAFWIGFAF